VLGIGNHALQSTGIPEKAKEKTSDTEGNVQLLENVRVGGEEMLHRIEDLL